MLGRSFSPEEMNQLCHHYLGIHDLELQIYEETFLGIAAFAERIYADYSLEDNEECYECIKFPSKQKHRCHKDQKNELEKADLSYLFEKLRNGLVQNELSHIFLSLCNKD